MRRDLVLLGVPGPRVVVAAGEQAQCTNTAQGVGIRDLPTNLKPLIKLEPNEFRCKYIRAGYRGW